MRPDGRIWRLHVPLSRITSEGRARAGVALVRAPGLARRLRPERDGAAGKRRGLPPPMRGRDADHRLHHRDAGRAGHPGAHRGVRHRAQDRSRQGSTGMLRRRREGRHRRRGGPFRRSPGPARAGVRLRSTAVLVERPAEGLSEPALPRA